jgi:transcriptional regulator with XRE-family HTH domain
MNEKTDKQRLVEIGKHIRYIRESLGMSLDELAASCDVEKSKISMIENGKKDFAITTLIELARGMGKHPKKILDHEFDFLSEWN